MNQHRLAQFLHSERRWIPFVNRELYWLKHKSGADRMEIRRRQAVMIIRRAASKLEPTPRIKAFSAWFDANVSDAIR